MMTDASKSVLVGVGAIGLNTEDGENHTLVADGQTVDLSTQDLQCLSTALDAYMGALK